MGQRVWCLKYMCLSICLYVKLGSPNASQRQRGRAAPCLLAICLSISEERSCPSLVFGGKISALCQNASFHSCLPGSVLGMQQARCEKASWCVTRAPQFRSF